MNVCNKCKVEREDNEFEKYWHSTKGKFYTRRICNPCMREGYRQYKFKIKEQERLKDIENNPDYKQCTECMDYKLLGEFYLSGTKKPVKMCKECHVTYYKNKVREKMEMKGGVDSYYKEPNKYTSEIQKSQVFMVMELLGWEFDGQVWNKPGVKENGVFINIIPTDKPKRRKPQTPHGRKVKSGIWNNVDKIVKLIEEGYSYSDVAETFDCSHTTIRSMITKIRNEKGTS